MTDILLTPDVCMRFLVWSYYYHDILPEADKSYADYGLFSQSDVARLDEIKAALFRCYEEPSVVNACQQFRLAKMRGEQCPYTQLELDRMFAFVL